MQMFAKLKIGRIGRESLASNSLAIGLKCWTHGRIELYDSNRALSERFARRFDEVYLTIGCCRRANQKTFWICKLRTATEQSKQEGAFQLLHPNKSSLPHGKWCRKTENPGNNALAIGDELFVCRETRKRISPTLHRGSRQTE